jgi:glutathione synthase/RimK-type ligase-like ATP-grasp enzyme
MQMVIVTDNAPYWDFLNEFPIIQAEDYLKGSPYQTNSIRLLNLCQSYDYQTIGYYVSLLAMAQDQKVSPSIQTIQDCTNVTLSQQFFAEMDDEIQESLRRVKKNELTLRIYFGGCVREEFAPLAKKIHEMFPLPLLTLRLAKDDDTTWSVKHLSILPVSDIPKKEEEVMRELARTYLRKKRFYPGPSQKQHFFHLAILVDPNEGYSAPSNQEALEKFVHAGESLGIHVDFIDKNDIKFIPEYAGLFTRTSPAVNHYTYQFTRYAAQENLAVIDEPQSIVKCRNKVYQAVAFQNHNITTPHTMLVSKYQPIPTSIGFPCIVKRPDSGYSKDVLKAENVKELKKVLQQFFKYSDLVIVQSFLPTEFDWRIGILDQKPLYAARYHMAKGHWQIINWSTNKDDEGVVEAVPLEQVPEGVVQIALNAANLIGNGLYGVDVKSCNDKNYVIEVNGNVSIDHGYEDQLLGDELYLQIMRVFLRRMQAKHGLQPAKQSHEHLVE